MIERYKVEEFLYGNLEKVKRKGDGYVMRCPICGDSKKHAFKRRLHVDYYPKYDEWVYKCYNGGCPENAGNIQSLYAHVMGVNWKEANDELRDRIYNAEKVKKKLAKKQQFVDEIDEKNEVLDLNTQDCLILSDRPADERQSKYRSKLIEFVLDRCIPLKYNPMVCFNGKYKNRFVLPVYNNGELVYFQTRAMYNFIEPKYLNPDVVKSEIILNIDKLDPSKPVVMCEGLLDAYSVEGFQGTSCLGAGIDDDLLKNIYSVYPDLDIIVALDNISIDESGKKNYEKLLKHSVYSRKLRYFFMPGTEWKDLNDVRREKGLKFNVLDFVEENAMNSFKASIHIRDVL